LDTPPRRHAEIHGEHVSLARMPGELSIQTLRPAFFSERDVPWLRALLDERERFAGRKRAEWKQRVSDGLPLEAPPKKLETALRVLERMSRDHARSAIRPREIRAALFHEAARTESKTEALQTAASKLGIDEQTAMECLFADLSDERVLTAIAPTSPEQFFLLCNGELIARLLARALRVRIRARGQVRAVVRQAKLMGLLCMINITAKDELSLEMSGPYALFRHTRIYTHALTSLLPRLAWCHSFRFEAECVLGRSERIGRLVLRSGDPILPARELAPCDSKLEERFLKTFGKIAPEWEVVREPAAFNAGDDLIFPDFELRHRATGERWLLEIMGYWTTEYIQRKLTALRAAKIDRLILCIDEARGCTDDALDVCDFVVPFRRQVDPRAVLAIIDPHSHATLQAATSKRSSPKRSTLAGR